MNVLWEALTAGLSNHDHPLRVSLHPFAAILLGGLIGLQRVSERKPSGLRTHILVCLGTTVFLLSCSSAALSLEGVSRVIRAIVTGIGFIGAGSILKLSEEHLIQCLTVSVRVWTTAAVQKARAGYSHRNDRMNRKCCFGSAQGRCASLWVAA